LATTAAAGYLGQSGRAIAQRVAAGDQAGVLKKATGALPGATASAALRGGSGSGCGAKKKSG